MTGPCTSAATCWYPHDKVPLGERSEINSLSVHYRSVPRCQRCTVLSETPHRRVVTDAVGYRYPLRLTGLIFFKFTGHENENFPVNKTTLSSLSAGICIEINLLIECVCVLWWLIVQMSSPLWLLVLFIYFSSFFFFFFLPFFPFCFFVWLLVFCGGKVSTGPSL